MGQICGSPIKGMGCSFMGVLFLSQCLRGSGLCNSSVHQGQAAIWERFSVLLPQTGMQIATALGRWCRESLPRFGICFSTTFLSCALNAFFFPLYLSVFQAVSSGFFFLLIHIFISCFASGQFCLDVPFFLSRLVLVGLWVGFFLAFLGMEFSLQANR